jgi:hypothetical protein
LARARRSISDRKLRALVEKRASNRCEYCHAPQKIAGYNFRLDHINPRSQGGSDMPHNRALACEPCNRGKSDYVVSIDPHTGLVEHLFHPRRDVWEEHFRWDAAILTLEGITPKGRATVQRLKMNDPSRLKARPFWVKAGLLP